MNSIFLILVCVSFFQLDSMEKKRAVGLNDVPTDVLAVYLVPRLIPGFYISFKNDEKLYNVIRVKQDSVLWQAIGNIALIEKRFYKIIHPAYPPYDTFIKDIGDSPTTYSLFELLQCFKFSQSIQITFEKEKEWWQIENEESMDVKIKCIVVDDVYTRIVMHIACRAESGYFPIEYYKPDIKKDSVKMSDSLKQFFNLIHSLKDHATSTSQGKKGTQEISIGYIFYPEQKISIKDVILICKAVQPFSFLQKKQGIDYLLETIKNLF